MFTPIHLLPQFDTTKMDKYQNRWQTGPGRNLEKKITEMIQDGAGEDFLQWDFENKRLGFLESMSDLKGFQVFKQRFEFAGGDTFQGIDFSYAQFYHSQFIHAVFNCNLGFARIYNCEFVDCVFSFNSSYGTIFEKVKFTNCEFFERNSFTNCDFIEVDFIDCFIPENIFSDCRFDENTLIGNLAEAPVRMSSSGLRLEDKERAGIYRGIKESYAAAGVVKAAEEYFLKQKQALTRHNSRRWTDKAAGYVLEFLTGYGVKPFRVLLALAAWFVIAFLVFSARVGTSDAALLTSGAIFTFGAKADLLDKLGIGYRLLYVFTSFVGIALTALFITAWASKWLRER